MKTIIYLVLPFCFLVGILCERQKTRMDYVYESESEEADSVSVETSVSVENSEYAELIPLPIGNLNSNRKKPTYVNNWQFTPPIGGDPNPPPTKEKILIEVTPKPPSSYRVKQKAKPFSGRHTTRRTTEAPLPENFQPQWAIDNSYYDKLFLSSQGTPKTTTTTTQSPSGFPWGHSSYEYETSVKKNPNYKARPSADSQQQQLNKLFGSPPAFDWGTLKPTEQRITTPRPSRRPGYLNPNPTVGVVSAEKETVKIKWKPKYTTVPFELPNDTIASTTPRTYPTERTTPRTTTTTLPVKIVTSFSIETTPTPTKAEVPVLLSLFNVTNLVGGAAAVNSIVNGVSNVSGTNENPISWVTSSVEQEHEHYEYPDEENPEHPEPPPLITEFLNGNSSENLDISVVNPVRNTETDGSSTVRPALPTRIRNTIDDLKQQLVVFVEDLWDRTLYGSGGGGGGGGGGNGTFPGGGKGGFGGKGGYGGKGGGKGGLFKNKGGGGGGGGNTWVGPYRSVLFQFNRFELNIHNGTVESGVIPEPVRKRLTGNERIQSRPQQSRRPFTRKAHPPVPMYSITDY